VDVLGEPLRQIALYLRFGRSRGDGSPTDISSKCARRELGRTEDDGPPQMSWTNFARRSDDLAGLSDAFAIPARWFCSCPSRSTFGLGAIGASPPLPTDGRLPSVRPGSANFVARGKRDLLVRSP